MIVLIFVIVLVLILVGALLGKIAWERAAILLLVTAVIFAAVVYLTGVTLP